LSAASDQLPVYVAALIANYSPPGPPPARRGRGRPRKEPRRLVDPDLRYAQVHKRREGGRVVEVKRQILSTTRHRAKITVILGVAPEACPQASGTLSPSQPTFRGSPRQFPGI